MSKRIPLTKGKFAIVDDEDYEYLSQFKWHFGMGDRYACRNVETERGWQPVSMHLHLVKPPPGMETDHINRNKLDNRRKNLRIVTRAINQRNKGATHRSRTGHPGIYPKNGKFHVDFRRDGRTHYVGTFATLRRAIRERANATRQYDQQRGPQGSEMHRNSP